MWAPIKDDWEIRPKVRGEGQRAKERQGRPMLMAQTLGREDGAEPAHPADRERIKLAGQETSQGHRCTRRA